MEYPDRIRLGSSGAVGDSRSEAIHRVRLISAVGSRTIICLQQLLGRADRRRLESGVATNRFDQTLRRRVKYMLEVPGRQEIDAVYGSDPNVSRIPRFRAPVPHYGQSEDRQATEPQAEPPAVRCRLIRRCVLPRRQDHPNCIRRRPIPRRRVLTESLQSSTSVA